MSVLQKYLIALFVFSAVSVDAQLIEHFGFQGGLSISNQRWEYTGTFEEDYRRGHRIGLNGSIFVESVIGKHWRIQLGGGGNQKGFREKFEVINTGVKGTQQVIANNVIHYGNYWLGGKYVFPRDRNSFYLIANVRMDVFGGRTTHKVYDAYFIKMKPWYPGVAGGAGCFFNVGKLKAYTEITYNPDIFPAFDRDGLHIYNNSLEVKFGILLPSAWIRKAIIANMDPPKS